MSGPQRGGHRAARHRRGGVSRSRRSRATTCCSSGASPRARACCRRSTSRAAPDCRSCWRPKPTTTTARKWRRSWTARRVVYAGEVADAAKAALLGGARALLYPVQAGEPFGLVLAEATTCGTPVAALDRGAVREVVEDGVTGGVFESLDALVAGLPRVLALDRARVRARGGRALRRRADGGRLHRRLPRRWRAAPRRARRADERRRARSRGPLAAGRLRASRRRVAGVRRAAGLVRRPRGARVAAVPVARRGGPSAGRRGRPGRHSRRASCATAAAALGLTEVMLLRPSRRHAALAASRRARARHPGGDRRADGRTWS